MGRAVFLIFANISIFFTLLVGFEILGQVIYYLSNERFVAEEEASASRLLFERHPFLAGRLKGKVSVVKNGKRITTTSMHTRWTGAPEDGRNLVRVAVMGGSTTFGAGVTDSDSWPALLQEKLGPSYAVMNFGVPGYSTAEAIVQMALLVPEVKPDVVVLYEGWNDIRNYHETNLGVDYYGHGMRQYGNLSITLPPESVFDKLATVSAIVKYVDVIKGKIFPQTRNPSVSPLAGPDPFVNRIYVRNLQTLKVLSDSIGAYTIFVPQLLNYAKFAGRRDSYEWSRYIENGAMPKLMGEFNALMQSVCPGSDPGCQFVERVLSAPWQPEDFVDNGHFSRNGGEKFAEILGSVILHYVEDNHKDV